MGMKSRALALVVAMVGAGVMSQAWASVVVAEASTTVQLSYQLIDLDLNDGITPWISFGPTSLLGMAVISPASGPDMDIRMFPGGVFGTLNAEHSSSDGLQQATFNPNEHSVSAVMTTDMLSLSPNQTALAVVANFYGTPDPVTGEPIPQDGDYLIRLSANTALVVNANTTFSASLNPSLLSGTAVEEIVTNGTNVGVYMDVSPRLTFGFEVDDTYLSPPDGWEYESLTSAEGGGNFYVELEGGIGGVDQGTQSSSGVLSATYYNGTNTAADVNFYYYATAQILSQTYNYVPVDPEWPPVDPPITPAIPEPSSAALMLLGLGGLAAAVRRQQLNRLKALTNG